MRTFFCLGPVRRRPARARWKAKPQCFRPFAGPRENFEIDFNGAPSRTTISRTTTGLLMEGAAPDG